MLMAWLFSGIRVPVVGTKSLWDVMYVRSQKGLNHLEIGIYICDSKVFAAL